jgi:hypothetical protein
MRAGTTAETVPWKSKFPGKALLKFESDHLSAGQGGAFPWKSNADGDQIAGRFVEAQIGDGEIADGSGQIVEE